MRWGGNDWDKYGKKLQKQVAFYETTCFCWSEMGDSNSRHLAPKASALPTALIPDFWVFSFAPDVVKHVVRRLF